MSIAAAEQLASSLLYEGYVLYPYRRSSLKNQQRWMFGSLYPPAFCAQGGGDESALQTECLVAGNTPVVSVALRFLHFVACLDATQGAAAAPWQEAIEQRIELPELSLASLAGAGRRVDANYPAQRSTLEGVDRVQDALTARLAVSCARLEDGLWKLRMNVRNRTLVAAHKPRAAALLHTLVSPHLLLSCHMGHFVSLLEPPEELAAQAASCENRGAFPVLVGEPGRDDTMLSSPIILYDRPRIAPESMGDHFDATEIDEMLALRILTLSDAEKREVLASDPRARGLLERTEALDPAALLGLHGARRPALGALGAPAQSAHAAPAQPASREAPASATESALRAGDRVLLRPRAGGDVFDLALAGQRATVVKVEEDFEGRSHYAVTVDADPGRDLGLEGKPGHRFYFAAEELERLP